MDSTKSFRVAVRKKIPYLTKLFLIIAVVCFLIILLFQLLFLPVRSSGQEMRVAFFYWQVSVFWKKVLIFSVIGLFTSIIIFLALRYFKAAVLVFGDHEILIRGKDFRLTIPVSSIKTIYCNDASFQSGESRNKLTIVIEQNKKATAIKLKDYAQAEYFMEQLMKYKGLDIRLYNFSYNPIHMDKT